MEDHYSKDLTFLYPDTWYRTGWKKGLSLERCGEKLLYVGG